MSTIPRPSLVMLVAAMVAFVAGGLAVTFQAAWYWWTIPVAAAALGIALFIGRLRARQRERERQRADVRGPR